MATCSTSAGDSASRATGKLKATKGKLQFVLATFDLGEEIASFQLSGIALIGSKLLSKNRKIAIQSHPSCLTGSSLPVRRRLIQHFSLA